MKITTLRWKDGSSDYTHVVSNDEVAEARFDQLRKADKDGLFDITQFNADTFTDALNYIKDETDAN